MFGILLGAVVLGLVIIVMEGADEFPGWWNLILCVLVAGIPMGLIDALLPRPIGLILGAIVGALAGGFAVSWRWWNELPTREHRGRHLARFRDRAGTVFGIRHLVSFLSACLAV